MPRTKNARGAGAGTPAAQRPGGRGLRGGHGRQAGILKKIFPSQKTATFRAPEYKTFFAENRHWLVPYAAFCFCATNSARQISAAGRSIKNSIPKKSRALGEGNDEIAFHLFLQYHLHRQLREATAHIHTAGLVLKGDLAIGSTARVGCLAASRTFSHGHAGWRAARSVCGERPELGLSHVQLAAHGSRWVRLVEAAFRPNG